MFLSHIPSPSPSPEAALSSITPSPAPMFANALLNHTNPTLTHRLLHIYAASPHFNHAPQVSLSSPLPHLPRPILRLCRARAQSASQSDSVVVKEDEEEESVTNNTRLLVQNVPWTATADDLKPLFQKYGTVVDIEFSMYNKNRNRGLAFVTMASNEEALSAINNLEASEFEGRVLKLNWAKPKKKKDPTPPPQPKPMPVHNLFIANLPFQARAKDLKEFFIDGGGNVVSAEVIFQDNRKSAGYGFVSFNTKAEAEAALTAFQGKEFMGRPIRVARSKKFLRQETKAAIESDVAGVV